MNADKIKVGSIIAFNKLPDAAWFIVIARDGNAIVVREHETNYAPQDADVCMVKQIR